MVTSIQLGNFFSANGRTVLGGVSGSGLDTAALLEALTTAKRLPAVKLESQLEINAAKSTALSEFRTLVAALKDASNFLRNPPGVNNAGENTFSFATASITSNTSVSGSGYLSVTAAAGALTQDYVISDITSIAKARQQTTANISIASENDVAVSATPVGGQFQAGTFTLNGQNITLSAGDTLKEVIIKFNAVSDLTGISASTIKVADGTFRVLFSATATGTANDFDLNDIGTVSSDPSGVMASVGITNTQAAADAIFKFNGIDITRSSNSISDIVSGVTFNILQKTPTEPDPTEITVSIKPDEQIARGGIINLINAYNDLKVFAAKQTEVLENGGFSEDAILADNFTFRSIVNSVEGQLTSFVSGLAAGDPNRLADIGITFIDIPESADTPQIRNVLSVDEGKLNSALATNYAGVRGVFEFNFTADSTDLILFSRTNALAVSEFTLNINPGTNTFEATYDIGAGPVTIDLDFEAIGDPATGYRLTGQDGTVLEGLVLLYTSTSAATIEVTTTQGLADKVFNIVDEPAKTTSGSITLAIQTLADSDDKLNENILRIDEQVAIFREQLLAKFQALEAALTRINVLLQSLDAQVNAQNNS